MTLDTQFWKKALLGDGCWEWQGVRNPRSTGYGQLKRNGKTLRAHRIAYEDWYGPIPAGMGVLHRCDNPPCIRPDHLFLGTPLDNAVDRNSKGRWTGERFSCPPERRRRGEEHPNAKLTREQVAAIRHRYAAGDVTYKALADEFGVSKSLVAQLVRGIGWLDG
jgi:hypothetical protein